MRRTPPPCSFPPWPVRGASLTQAIGESAPLGLRERLGAEIARCARGNCIKGESADSRVDLLGLPSRMMAELRDKCRHPAGARSARRC